MFVLKKLISQFFFTRTVMLRAFHNWPGTAPIYTETKGWEAYYFNWGDSIYVPKLRGYS